MPSSATFLGTVQDVQGATISIALDNDTISGLVFIDGHGYRIGQVGSFVRIPIGFSDLFGVVSQVGAGAVPEALAGVEPYGRRWLRVQLIGESEGSKGFSRGISQYPTINDEVHLVTEQDLSQVYGRPDAPNFVRIGNIASAESIPALIDIDRLVTRHSAVLGATGAGKSTTVVNLLVSLTDPQQFPSARVIVMDIHGEYHSALSDRATVFRVGSSGDDVEQLYVPYWAMNFDELINVTPFQGVKDIDRTALVEKIKELKLSSLNAHQRNGVTPDTMTVDTPIPFSIHRLWYEMYRLICSTHTAQGVNQSANTEAIEKDSDSQRVMGDIMRVEPPKYRPITSGGSNRVFLSGSSLNMRREVLATESLLRDTRYDFLFRPGPWCPHPDLENLDAQPARDLGDLLRLWIGGERPVTILDLSGIPTSILMSLIGVILRILFDALFWSRHLPEGGRARPLLVVLEEAHAYLGSKDGGAASASARRIVKEGRKYGLGAMVVSQRPSEIDSTILSQCGTMFAMRLPNTGDRSQVTGTVSDNLEGLFNMLPALRTGEAIAVGEAVHLPLRVLVDAPEKKRRPDSGDPRLYDSGGQSGWNSCGRKDDYDHVVEKWRSEEP